ncbi:membrane progestin receptor beta-like [Lytechinus variegatus]|uniref:membrane progestin receptor beta-like n=1 Tax=Lytechinus variegatus TaxID=7654 RepID=UPI001BB1D585|nr:membrane progestin receptor beta-like [Lytechinus variegatus]
MWENVNFRRLLGGASKNGYQGSANFNTRDVDEVPVIFQEPFVKYGYREPHHSLTYYAKSFLELHNESLNVWTHAAAFSILFYQSFKFCAPLDIYGDPYALIFVIFCGCCCVLPLMSALAHLFHSHSELTHYTCWFIDYLGMSIYGFGGSLAHFYFSALPSFVRSVSWFFMPMMVVLSYGVCFCCSYAKYRYKRPYPFARKLWQLGSVGAGYVLIIAPIYHRLLGCFFSNQPLDSALFFHFIQVSFIYPSVFFFAMPYPQKFHPGKYDILGHSHQIFHVAMAFVMYYQMKAAHLDFLHRRDEYSTLTDPSFLEAMFYISILVIADVATLFAFRHKVWQKISKIGTD